MTNNTQLADESLEKLKCEMKQKLKLMCTDGYIENVIKDLVEIMSNENHEKILNDRNNKKNRFNNSLDTILSFLADTTPKERESFLSSWRTSEAHKKIGRKKSDITKTYQEYAEIELERMG